MDCMSKDHLVLSKFLLKNFEIEGQAGKIYRLEIDAQKITKCNWKTANTQVNFYSSNNENAFSKIENEIKRFYKSAVAINYGFSKNTSAKEFIDQAEAKRLITEWVLMCSGRMHFNTNQFNNLPGEYAHKMRNDIIQTLRINNKIPQVIKKFINNSYITLWRNSTNTSFVLGMNHWIENELNGFNLCIFAIAPKLAIIVIDYKWYLQQRRIYKSDDVFALNYDNPKYIRAVNELTLETTKNKGLNEIYSTSKKELENLITKKVSNI